MRNFTYKKGDILEIDLGIENKEGSEQKGRRPCVVIQNDIENRFSPCLIVAPITKADKKYMPTHVNLDCEKYKLIDGSRILGEQIITVSKSRCEKFITRLDNQDIERVDCALTRSLQICQ